MQLVHRTTTSSLPVRSCLQPRRPVHRLLVRAQTPQQRSETGSDASTSGTGSNNNNDDNKRNPLRALLERLPKGLPQTVLAFRDSVGQQINSTPKAIWILVGFLAIAAGRNIFFGGQRPAPREVRAEKMNVR